MSNPKLTPLCDAVAAICAAATATSARQTLALANASGRVLASDVIAKINVPPADNSAMDGYAFHTDSLSDAGATLVISQRIAAGQVATALVPGTCARIFTGAEIPVGANAVAMQEVCTETDAGVVIPAGIAAQNNLRKAGSDIQQGQTILVAGTQLSPQNLGLLASIGIAEVAVYANIKVAVIATGDELVEPGQPLQAGKIYNSNRAMLSALVSAFGAEVVDLGAVADNREATIDMLRTAAVAADLVISTGGVSVGDEDHVKAALETLGQLQLWKLALKPGKPLAFGHIGRTPFFGLPGNPVAVFVTFLLCVRPLLKILQGHSQSAPLCISARANFCRQGNQLREEYLRVKLNNDGSLDAYTNQNSGVLSSVSWANGLARLPANTDVKVGDPLTVLLFNELLS